MQDSVKNPIFLENAVEPGEVSQTRRKNQHATWRDNWIAKYALFEVAVIGDALSNPDIEKAFPKTVKSVFMLVGGVLLMMLNPTAVSMSDDKLTFLTLGSINMAIGMTVSRIIFNILFHGVPFLYSKYFR